MFVIRTFLIGLSQWIPIYLNDYLFMLNGKWKIYKNVDIHQRQHHHDHFGRFVSKRNSNEIINCHNELLLVVKPHSIIQREQEVSYQSFDYLEKREKLFLFFPKRCFKAMFSSNIIINLTIIYSSFLVLFFFVAVKV